MLDTVSSGGLQSDMFGFTEGDPKSEALMEVIDRIKQKYPNSPVKSASEGKVQAWKMQRNYLSPNYTGNWNDLLKVK